MLNLLKKFEVDKKQDIPFFSQDDWCHSLVYPAGLQNIRFQFTSEKANSQLYNDFHFERQGPQVIYKNWIRAQILSKCLIQTTIAN